MALYPFRETNPVNIDELYLCELHPNWNAALEWREYITAFHQERALLRGDDISLPLGHYRKDHMTRWLESHEHGSVITASLPVRRAKDNMIQATNKYVISIAQDILWRYRRSVIKQAIGAGNASLKPRLERVKLECKNSRLTRILRYTEMQNSISEWILSILNYTRNTFYPHLKREA